MATDPFIPVELVGGPDDWHGTTLDRVHRASPWHVDRIHVHWIYDHEGQSDTDLGVWQVTAHSPNHTRHWELIHDPGAGGWTAAHLPSDPPN